MASEIDEAAEVERARWIENVVSNVYTKREVNLARAALAWKARAEAAGARVVIEPRQPRQVQSERTLPPQGCGKCADIRRLGWTGFLLALQCGYGPRFSHA